MALAQQNSYPPYPQPYQQEADVLLVTVTEIEAKAVLRLCTGYERRFIGPESRTYYDLGAVNNARVFMVQSEMGVTGPGSALLTVLEGILALSPLAVIMVGIAFGVKPAEQKIGDIVVSTHICDYNQQRVGTDPSGQPDIRLRGNRIPASMRLLDKFRAGAKDWPSPPKIYFGPVLSGEKLVDNLEYRNQLLKLEPDALGGEMEGAALPTADQRRKVDWILVKAICDWADGNKAENKEQYQQEAADNAARFVLHIIKQGGLSRQHAQVELAPPSEPMWKLPSTLTSLIGREPEIAAISAFLRLPEVHLLTLLGPGGIGKTRLSIAVALAVREFFEAGICFVPLAAISDPQLVLPTITQELDLKESGTAPLLKQLQTFVGKQPFLLVLDNFEQVVAAAPQIEELLAGCPQLKILVTSRAVLHLSAEQVVPVVPLALPTLSQDLTTERITQSAAVTLFVQRARSILPSFQLTPANAQALAEVCVRLDGLPLAIELAAARIKLLPPQALLARLSQRLQLLTGGPRTLPARQQTLRSTIQWSYDLLGPQEQLLFRLLSVFVGGWTLEAAEALCQQTGKADLDILNTLSTLLDNSLIQPSEQEAEEPRFLMLQTVCEFGLERLAASGEREVAQQAHAAYYLALAQEAEPHLTHAVGIRRRPRNRRNPVEPVVWLERLEREYENLRAALQWAAAHGNEEMKLALQLSSGLLAFWSWAKEPEQ